MIVGAIRHGIATTKDLNRTEKKYSDGDMLSKCLMK
jgi:hypothetical protein